MIDLDALEAAARAATPGPWVRDGTGIYSPDGRITDVQQEPGYIGSPDFNNSKYIALANPAAILALVGRLRDAESDRDRLTVQNNRLRVVLAEYADRGSWACSRNTEYRDLWLLYEHGYSRAWGVLEQEWPARAALGGEARDAE
jgi:hypothetical protein